METRKRILQDRQVSEVEIKYSQKINKLDRITIHHPETAVEVLRHIWNEDTIELQESFKVILLNRSNEVLGVLTLSDGGITSTTVDFRMLYGCALKAMASSIIIAHNHPSGKSSFSKTDIEMTKKIVEAGLLLDIKVLDHILLTKEGYTSAFDLPEFQSFLNYQNNKG